LPAYQRIRELARALKIAVKDWWRAKFGGAG
jgi:hypothetical protein